MNAGADTRSRKRLRGMSLTALVPCVLLALVFWYLIKLSYTYTAAVPVTLRLEEGARLRVNPMVEATGYELFMLRYVTRSRLDTSLEALGAVPSAVNEGSWVVDPLTLQNLISVGNQDLRIVSMGEIPEITPENENRRTENE